MTFPPKRFDPDDFRLSKLVEAFYALEFISDDVYGVMLSEPVVEGCLSP